MLTVRTLVVVLAAAAAVMASSAFGQTWMVNGSSMCFNFGQISQCSTSASIQQATDQASQFQQQYAAGYAAGQAIGGLTQSIAAAWAEHRARVNADRDDARGRLVQYSDNAVALMQEDVEIQNDTLLLYEYLKNRYPANSATYDEGAAISRRTIDLEKHGIEQTPKNVAIIGKAKDLKFLSENPDRQKKFYESVYANVGRSYVWEQLLIARATFLSTADGTTKIPILRTASLTGQPATPSPTPPPASMPQDVFVWFDEPAPVPGATLFEVLVTARARRRAGHLAESTPRKYFSADRNKRARYELSFLDSESGIVAEEQSKVSTVALLLARRRGERNDLVMHFQMTKRAYEQMLALVAGSDLRMRPSQASNPI